MKIKNGLITEATESELFSHWIESCMCDIMSFEEYKNQMKEVGVKILEVGENQMNNIERAIEELKREITSLTTFLEMISNNDNTECINHVVKPLKLAIQALQEKKERDKELEMFKNGNLVFSSLSDDATISVLKQWVGEKEVKDKLIKILEEEQEREKGCKFCKTAKCGNCLDFESTNRSRCSSASEQEACIKYKPVNFCKHCGRKLGGEDNDLQSQNG